MTDYHVHTLLCNHASGTMEQYIRCAVEKGLSEICFLDHLTLNEKGRALSMGPKDVPLYVYAVRRLGEKYKGQIHVKAGLEVDFSPVHAEAAAKIVERFSLDVAGVSVHFVDDQNIVSSNTGASSRKDFKPGLYATDKQFYDRYLALVDKMLDYSCFDVVCHLDVVKKFGKQPPDHFLEKMDAILEKIKYKNFVVEINTSGLSHPAGAAYPDPSIIHACFQKNIPVTFGSDAHKPEQVGRDFRKAVDLLRNAGYSSITGFNRQRRYAIPI